MGSWLSQILHAVANGVLGRPNTTHPDQTPLHEALDKVSQAASQISSALGSGAKATVDAYLTTKIGPVGAEVADAALQSLATEALSRLSTANKAETAVPAAA